MTEETTEEKIACPFCGYLHEYESKGTVYCPECRYLISTEEWNILMKKAREASTHTEYNTGINCVTKDATGNTDYRESSGNDASTSSGDTPDICPGCGVKLSPGTMRTASSCPFCGHKIADNSKSNGNNHPDFIVRFRKNKSFFISSLKEAVKSSVFVSEEFRQAVTSGNIRIKAVYVPFRLFNIRTEGSIKYDTAKIHYVNRVTRHTLCNQNRTGTMVIRNLPQKATSEINDGITEALEPFPVNEYESLNYHDFQSISEQIYGFEDNCPLDITSARAINYFEKFLILHNTQDIDYYHVDKTTVKQTPEHIHSTMFPLFIAEIDIKGETCQFAMNGLTGKTGGNIPYSRFKRNICYYTGGIFFISTYFGSLTWLLLHLMPAHEPFFWGIQVLLFGAFFYASIFFIKPFFGLLRNNFFKSDKGSIITGMVLIMTAEFFMNFIITDLPEKFIKFSSTANYLTALGLFLILTATLIQTVRGIALFIETTEKSRSNNETVNTVDRTCISAAEKKAGIPEFNIQYERLSYTIPAPAIPDSVIVNQRYSQENINNSRYYENSIMFFWLPVNLLSMFVVVQHLN
jgi:uncharacterized Zn finger protein (UPF0148 family)